MFSFILLAKHELFRLIHLGDDFDTQQLVNMEAIDALINVVKTDPPESKKDALWALSSMYNLILRIRYCRLYFSHHNLVAGTRAQVQAVMDANIIPEIIKILLAPKTEWYVKNEGNFCHH